MIVFAAISATSRSRSTRPPTAKATSRWTGKKQHVVLIDFNSNGRFDDEIKINDERPARPTASVYPEQGDMLLVDPEPDESARDSPYDVTDQRQPALRVEAGRTSTAGSTT